jgi:hypothetical protein
MLAFAILYLQSVIYPISSCGTAVLTKYILYTYRFTIYCFSLIVILAGTRVSSYITLIKPASKTI